MRLSSSFGTEFNDIKREEKAWRAGQVSASGVGVIGYPGVWGKTYKAAGLIGSKLRVLCTSFAVNGAF